MMWAPIPSSLESNSFRPSPPHCQTLFLLADSRAAHDGADLGVGTRAHLDGHTARAGGGCVSHAIRRLMLDTVLPQLSALGRRDPVTGHPQRHQIVYTYQEYVPSWQAAAAKATKVADTRAENFILSVCLFENRMGLCWDAKCSVSLEV
jgi:hypothetical protein